MEYDIKITDIMKEIGCGSGFHIPVANEENQLLENEIKELLKKKATLLVTDELLEKELLEYPNIKNNFLTQEIQNQKLIIANRKQFKTEQHMLIVSQQDNDNLSRDNKAASKKLNELIEDQNKIENELTKNEDLIKKMRETVEWGEETLLAWNNDLAKRNTDVNILETYHLEDNYRFKELDLRRQYLQRDVIERELIVEKEVNELIRVERELEQTSKLTRQAQNERNHLLEQWENAANFLNANQKDSQKIVDEINQIREAAREVYDNMSEDKQKYQDHLEANEELELEIDESHKTNNELKLTILNKITENENLQSEVLVAQKALNVVGNKLANERTKRRYMQNELAQLKTKIQQKEEEIELIKDNMIQNRSKSMTTEERLNELDKIYENQKAKTQQLMSEKKKIQNMLFNVKNEIKQIQSKIDLLINQLEISRNEQIMMSKEESKIKKLIMSKTENLYHLSFQLEIIRMQIAEAQGIVNVEEMHSLQEKLQVLNEDLATAQEKKHLLEKQLKSIESESCRINKDVEKNSLELETFRNQVEELSVRNEGGEKQIQLLKEENHRYHMEEIMMKLKVEQMKKWTEKECEKVYSLAQQREELTADINKRKAEVAAIHERINGEKKLLSDEKSSMKRKLDSLVQYIEQRKNKYQILSATIGVNAEGNGNDDDDDTNGDDDNDRSSFTISGHRIRVAREKLELQDTGDRLDERVQKLEIEIRAMENTLHVLNASNSCYKSSLSSVNPSSDEYKGMIILEETYEKLNSMLMQKKKTLENMETAIRDLEGQCKESNEELENLTSLRDIKDCELERAVKEANEQMMKLNRANNRIQFDMKAIDKNCDPDKQGALELIKRDIAVRMMKKVNKCVLELLSEMSVRHIGVEPTIKQYLSEKDLELPTVSGLSLIRIKSSCDSSGMSLNSSGSCNSSVKSYTDEDRKSSYSIVNLEPMPNAYARKSGTSIVNK